MEWYAARRSPEARWIRWEPRRTLAPEILDRLRDLKRSGDTGAMAEAAYSAGETLAAIGRATFAKPGWLGPGPAVTAPLLEGKDPTPRFVDLCLGSIDVGRRMEEDLRHRTSGLVWRWAAQLARLDEEARLVHGDFNGRNLLVQLPWRAVVGGRRARLGVRVSGSPLGDMGNFLRYERAAHPLAEPHFSAGYCHAGGALPWIGCGSREYWMSLLFAKA